MTVAADGLTVSLILLAALLHASWNALAKASGDPMVNLAVVMSTGGVIALPFVLLQPLPGPEVWIWLGLSAGVHFAYQIALTRLYALGELSQVYPIARGLAPLGVAAVAFVGAGEALPAHRVLGLLIASAALIVLGRSGRPGRQRSAAVATALVTAVLIVGYTYSDARGVRAALRPEYYIAWSFVLGCVPFALATVWLRGREGLVALRRDGARAVGGGVMATVGYAIALWAYARAPMASVVSLRESSVLFAALIGAWWLREPFGLARSLAASGLVVGLLLVQWPER